ncbi:MULTISPECIES: glycosyltransferase family 2 protein [Methylomonas]|uniref:Glycosyl transferase family 2 n=1 Tax=Methylomonas methanica TaxID=421 RepID=A0ABY2CM73_METMH|nr:MULTISPECIES: glycosyltransferase [Methylomonas]TCV83550.1 glycosyl transferase family 2 [Methylomonas methanica]
MTSPLITVLMPVFNGEAYLSEAIESILTQSFKDFELLIIDDGSTDNTFEIIKTYENSDSRIRVIQNKKNIGIALSLNIGLAHSKSSVIARMDADDISTIGRLETQWKFLQNHPEVSVIGSYYRTYENRESILKVPIKNENIKTRLLFDTCFYHPTVMFRKKIVLDLVKPYRSETVPAEDYDLWCRLADDRNVIFANINEPLLCYRTYSGIDRSEYLQRQFQCANDVRNNQLFKLKLYPTDKELTCHNFLANPYYFTLTDAPSLLDCSRWLHRIRQTNLKSNIYSENILMQELEYRWVNTCLRVALENPGTALIFIQSNWTSHSLTRLYLAIRMIWRYIKKRL